VTDDRARQRELRNAGVLAAREARQLLARAVSLLDAEAGDPSSAQLAADLSAAIGSLFGCEIGDATEVLDKMRAASAVLSGVLTRLHGPSAGTATDAAGELVARSLAALYPVRAGLERDLAQQRAERLEKPVRAAETVGAELTEQERAELDAVRTLAAQASPAPIQPLELPRTPISVRPVPLIDARPPPQVAALLTMAPDAPLGERTSFEAAAIFPEAGEDSLPPLLLTDKRGGRKRRRAIERVSDAYGALVDVKGGVGQTPPAGRRVQDRVALEVDIGLHSATQFYAGLSNDISEGGLFISTVRPLPVGSELTISFVLPGGHSVTTRGRVAWLATPRDGESTPGMGVRFVRLEPEHRAAIDKFLRYRPAMLHEL